MRHVLHFLFWISITPALADPSTTSIETGVMGNLESRFVVAASDERQIADKTWRYWIVMPNTSASELRIELGEITFAAARRGDDPVVCNVKDCFGVFRPLRIDPSETLFIASNREVLGLTLRATGEEGHSDLPTLVGLFTDCVEDLALMDALFREYRSWTHVTRVVYAPFPAVSDLGIEPVCIR